MNDKDLMGDIDINTTTRRRAYDYITKPVYRDPQTGEYLTALMKYEHDHRD